MAVDIFLKIEGIKKRPKTQTARAQIYARAADTLRT